MMYVRFPLSLRQVEDLLVRAWHRHLPRDGEVLVEPFWPAVRRRRSGGGGYHRRNCYSNWRWHLDEVFVRINGETYYLWRAVDHEGEVLEVFATKRRDRRAALKFLRCAMKRYGRPASIVTDRLRSYRAAMNVIGNAAAQTCGRWLDNRAGKLASTVSKAGRGDGSVQRHQDLAEIRRRPRLDPQPFQPRPPSQPPRYFQTRPSRCLGRVASTCCLKVLYYGFFCSGLVSLTMPFHGLLTQPLLIIIDG